MPSHHPRHYLMPNTLQISFQPNQSSQQPRPSTSAKNLHLHTEVKVMQCLRIIRQFPRPCRAQSHYLLVFQVRQVRLPPGLAATQLWWVCLTGKPVPFSLIWYLYLDTLSCLHTCLEIWSSPFDYLSVCLTDYWMCGKQCGPRLDSILWCLIWVYTVCPDLFVQIQVKGYMWWLIQDIGLDKSELHSR